MKTNLYKKTSCALLAAMMYTCILGTIYFIDIHYFTVDVLLYSAIGCGALASSVMLFILLKMSVFNILGVFEKFLLLIIFFLSSYILAISIPTIIDRSLSIFMLDTLANTPKGFTASEFSELAGNEYLNSYHAVDVRITEQLKSGTIYIDANGRVFLTDRGMKVVEFSKFFKSYLLPKKRNTFSSE